VQRKEGGELTEAQYLDELAALLQR
jgi:hypothetical protein